MNLITEIDRAVAEAIRQSEKPVDGVRYIIVDKPAPHNPDTLPSSKMGICMFWHKGAALKIGRAGPKSNPRFLSQHYNPNSSRSNLAASILLDRSMKHLGITEVNVGDWIKNNCRRIDILFDKDLGIPIIKQIKKALIEKYNPRYEGRTI
jgi:hypothetical protein